MFTRQTGKVELAVWFAFGLDAVDQLDELSGAAKVAERSLGLTALWCVAAEGEEARDALVQELTDHPVGIGGGGSDAGEVGQRVDVCVVADEAEYIEG